MSDYYVKHLEVSLSLEEASSIMDAALQCGRKEGLLPLAVAVLDSGGHLVAFKREDGCGIMRGDIAMGKAWGALGMGISSRTIRDRLAERIAFQAALATTAQGKFVPVPGGVLICTSDQLVIGAIGISGDASDRDEFCAIEGIKAVSRHPHPEVPVEHWQDASL